MGVQALKFATYQGEKNIAHDSTEEHGKTQSIRTPFLVIFDDLRDSAGDIKYRTSPAHDLWDDLHLTLFSTRMRIVV